MAGYLEMEMRHNQRMPGIAGLADRPDSLPLTDPLARGDLNRLQVRVEAAQPVTMVQLKIEPAASMAAGCDDAAAADRPNRTAQRGFKIHPPMRDVAAAGGSEATVPFRIPPNHQLRHLDRCDDRTPTDPADLLPRHDKARAEE